MIIVAGTVEIQVEKRTEAIAAAQTMVAATVQEKGCITYQFYEDISIPGRMLVYEQWESDEALAAHMQTPHMAEFNKVLPGILAGKPDIHKFEISASTKLV
ncbi:MAG: putative quinol monooxygenase [Chloroflexota bacterium]